MFPFTSSTVKICALLHSLSTPASAHLATALLSS